MLRALLLSTVLFATPALARENYALLIGASQYPSLDEKSWLKGPANDVTLVRTYLTTSAPVAFAPQNVAVLADGVAGSQAPTLAAIRTAFADLTAQVQPGDFVYLHFSGHGSQAPAANPDTELDGLDELFLPTDIGVWSDAVGAVETVSPALASLAHHLGASKLTKTSPEGCRGRYRSSTGGQPAGWNSSQGFVESYFCLGFGCY